MAEKTPRSTWCVGVVKLEKDPGGDEIKNLMWQRMMRLSRFRSVLKVGRFGGAYHELPMAKLEELRDGGYLWSEILPEGTATPDDVFKVVGETDLWEYDRLKPLWRIQFVRKMADGSARLIVTINHAVGDGMALIEALLQLSDQAGDVEKLKPRKSEKPGGKSFTEAAAGKRVPRPPTLTRREKFNAFMYGGFAASLNATTDTGKNLRSLPGVYHGLTSSTWAPDPKNSLTMPDTMKPSRKLIAECDTISLAELKK